MPNNQMNKTPMPELAPAVRGKCFDEVARGYDSAQAKNEADRCLQCKHRPCEKGCPVGVKIPPFIDAIARENPLGAYKIIREDNALPAICGRVCPQENQCEKHCVRGIKGEPVAIGRLERFAADAAMAEGAELSEPTPPNGMRVAVIGSGPASLSCAGALVTLGYGVTVFEALHEVGGVLSYGIPEFRLPKALVKREIDSLRALGVEIVKNVVVGKSVTIDELLGEMGYKAVFVGSGAGLPRFQGIEGESLCGVYSANEFLTRINLMKAYDFPNHLTPIRAGRRVFVIGGGNVAMDAARCALRMGAERVSVAYRRGEEEMPARLEEIHHAKDEGIDFLFLTNPTRILGDEKGNVTGIELQSMELGEEDASGRRRPVKVPGSETIFDADTVIVAIGNSPNPLIVQTTDGIEAEKWGGIITGESGATTKPFVFAGGDAVTGAATVILAMGAGKRAAFAIDEALRALRGKSPSSICHAGGTGDGA